MDSPDPPLWLGINPANGHPGPLATRVHAVETANILEAHYPEALGKKTLPVDTVEKVHINDWVPAEINFQQNDKAIFFVYPNIDIQMLTMPIRKPYVQLNLENPARVSQITLNGAALKSADVYISSDDADKHFDDGSLIELGKKKGSCLNWTLPLNPRTARVNTIRISAEFKNSDHRLVMDVVDNQSASVIR